MSFYKIIVINPGSTSTKVAVTLNTKLLFLKNIKHSLEEISQFRKIADQYEFRKKIILDELEDADINISKVNAVIGRGGLLKPIEGGVYRVNEAMIRDIHNPMGEHVSNLGGIIAYEIAAMIGKDIPAFISDPTCMDELEDVARISGLPEIPRLSFLHALNQKATARRFAKENGKHYEEMNLIVVHMGGGITVGAHKNGRIIDTNNGLNGDGPFSPERAGGLPSGQLVELCYSEKYTKTEVLHKLKGGGGMIAHLGTTDLIEVEDRIEKGDKKAELIYEAMVYQTAKLIGGMSTVLKGKVEGIILTGGIAFSEKFTTMLIERINHLGPIVIYPGEDEMLALAMNCFMALKGELDVKEYI
ncbi:MAG: butyrate kinase [Bacteroidetes bacterium GWF2_38_335]|nr:MAG: butyrate kinase [Bacteroidetes bacterium GWF2_38_335]OFY79012.1 MAG: butyrate kinase [Bacteroidetes bacterium RIFOXYA12_FULL_38_20]HBS86089.1 butyrate kinase [Bacteroidales bacterium]